MESIDQVWLFVAIALVAGVVLGAILHKMLSASTGDVDKLRAELERARSEMESYKASVNRHFSKTADLVDELTQDYAKVYQHLAEGAQTLSDSPEYTRLLNQPEGRVLLALEGDNAAQEPAGDEPQAAAAPHDAMAASSEAGDAENLAGGKRKAAVTGDGQEDAEGDPPMTPAAPPIDTVQESGHPQAGGKT